MLLPCRRSMSNMSLCDVQEDVIRSGNPGRRLAERRLQGVALALAEIEVGSIDNPGGQVARLWDQLCCVAILR